MLPESGTIPQYERKQVMTSQVTQKFQPVGATAEAPLRALTEEEIATYERDGVVLVRKIFPERWVTHVAEAIDDMVTRPTPYGRLLSNADRHMYSDLFMWKYSDAFREFVYHSPAARIAAQVMHSQRVNFLGDHMFRKDAGCEIPTNWHTDDIAWPVAGRQAMNIWLACDEATAHSSALQFIRGSHLWESARATRLSGATGDDRVEAALSKLGWKPSEGLDLSQVEQPATMRSVIRAAFHGVHRRLEEEMACAPLPNGQTGLVSIEAHRDQLPIVSWDVEPGDALIFSLRTLHYSTGNASETGTRRALATRWLGDDTRYAPTTGNLPVFWRHGLRPGDRFGGPLFPQILPDVVPGEGAERFAGPEEADPQIAFEDLRARVEWENEASA